MTVWEAALLGLIQGVFMFFPVSSTSHLVLAQHALIQFGSELPPPESPEMILFDLVVHVGTLVSIAVVMHRSLARLGARALSDAWAWVRPPGGARRVGLHLRLVGLGLLSTAVTGLLGLAMREEFAQVFAHPAALVATLGLTGAILWWTDTVGPRPRGLREITVAVAVGIGVAQALALLPGISRSGMTIAVALALGLKRRWAAEYSFFVAIPTIVGGSALQTLLVWRDQTPAALEFGVYAVGFVVAAAVGVAALALVLALLYRARFRVFSYYVWALAAAVGAAALAGWL